MYQLTLKGRQSDDRESRHTITIHHFLWDQNLFTLTELINHGNINPRDGTVFAGSPVYYTVLFK